jgi:hypothetical protein
MVVLDAANDVGAAKQPVKRGRPDRWADSFEATVSPTTGHRKYRAATMSARLAKGNRRELPERPDSWYNFAIFSP